MYINDMVKARTMPMWNMRQQRRSNPLMVGTDIFKMAEMKSEKKADGKVQFAGSDAVENFYRPGDVFAKSQAFEKNDYAITIGMQKSEDGESETLMATVSGKGMEPMKVAVTGDTRITFNKDGAPVVQTGKEALSGGKLVGRGNDVLIRMSGTDVSATEGDVTLVNLSSAKGIFDGGSATMTYLGQYENASIRDGAANNYAGNFINSRIDGGNGINEFSGFFSKSVLEGGENQDRFTGKFTNGSMLNGNDGDDQFTGFFQNSELNGGNGMNTFAYRNSLQDIDNLAAAVSMASLQYAGSTIDAGESSRMQGVFMNADITVGGGKHNITGVFSDTRFTNKDSAETSVNAYFAAGSSFYGETGSTSLTVQSGRNNAVELGDGNNDVNLGFQSDTLVSFLGQTVDMGTVRWYTANENISSDYQGTGYGTLEGNSVDVSRGNVNLALDTGTESVSQSVINAPDQLPEAQKKMAEQNDPGKNAQNSRTDDSAENDDEFTSAESFYKFTPGDKEDLLWGDKYDQAVTLTTSNEGSVTYFQNEGLRQMKYRETPTFSSRHSWEV